MGLTGRSLGRCQEKKTFNERTLAVEAARQASASYGEKLKAYCCQFCGKYHLARKRNSYGRRI